MRLSELINGDRAGHAANLEIRGLAADSREVRPGFLFAALPGLRHDGIEFVAEAIDHGAVAVLAPQGAHLEADDVALVTDDNPRRRLALMAARFYRAQPGTIAAVTGTNGKTSVVEFTRQIWHRLGYTAASLGTLGVRGGEVSGAPIHTTPDPVTLHRALSELSRSGISHLAIEASSHGLDQCRLDGLALTAAAFTNISRDHLDYHHSPEAYLEAKLGLFNRVLEPGGTAVLNADAPEFPLLAALCAGRGQRVVGYGVAGEQLRLLAHEPAADGQRLRIEFAGAARAVEVPLVGGFQAGNVLCALGLVLACGADADAAFAALAALDGVPGRMQPVARAPQGGMVYVDYAHTPDALEQALRALRPHVAGRLHVVFGCGGERDVGKRPLMGAIAAELAETIIVTDDNPRGEDPARIRRAVLEACPGARDVGDRAAAIAEAIAAMAQGDVLLIAGKGHERGQDVGGVVRPFDDAEEARAAARALGGEAL